MNKSLKAALLSGLVFPGVGQISLGYKKRGWLIIAANAIFLYLIISEVMRQAYGVIAEMQKSGSVLDIEAISNTTSGLVGFSDNSSLNTLLLLLIAVWIFSVFDAYRLGKNKHKI